MSGSFDINKHYVSKIFMINGLDFQTLQFKNLLLSIEKAKHEMLLYDLQKLLSYASAKLQNYSFDRTEN